ncbi:MAG TPA: universal stress protein [Actinomycetota bacterium]|nr:universal stress protein [Actinomycetota bacterium]
MGYRTIVVGTDGSETAMRAEAWAAKLAKRFRAQLVIVSGFDRERIQPDQALGVVEAARERVKVHRIDAEVECHGGEPADVVLTTADRRDADLVVVGNRGMGKARRFKLGSVPERVATYAPCDVLITDTTSGRASEGRNYGKILMGTDGSPTATEAARKGFELALMVDADVTLVYVGDELLGSIALEKTADAAPDGVNVERRVVPTGDPAEIINDIAEEESHDLVVVGNKGMAGSRRFLLGSVPNKVAHGAPCDVLIARTTGLGIEDIAPGHGGVVEVEGKRLAIYRDEAGAVHALSPKCAHMGCTVDWNDGDQTWDCPCHGSRYQRDGEVIRGPATHGLAPADVPV